MNKERPVLVIKLGALGDFVQALGPFNAIRKHHASRQIVLLTTPPFVSLAEASGYFDDIHAGIPRLVAIKSHLGVAPLAARPQS